MTKRVPVVGGNWKMNLQRRSAVELAAAIADGAADLLGGCEVVVYPPFPYLMEVGGALGRSGVRLGAQDVYPEPEGAFTGEVSAAMLLDVGVTDVLVGHSERRHVIGEPEELINRKVAVALGAGLRVTLCVGETLEQREAGSTEEVNIAQLRSGLAGIGPEQLSRVIIAYEPVWAIGTGRTASPEDAQAVHALLRAELAALFDESIAKTTRIQYGGSVKANNAGTLFGGSDVDGGLIGGASLKHAEFLEIVRAAVECGSLVTKKV